MHNFCMYLVITINVYIFIRRHVMVEIYTNCQWNRTVTNIIFLWIELLWILILIRTWTTCSYYERLPYELHMPLVQLFDTKKKEIRSFQATNLWDPKIKQRYILTIAQKRLQFIIPGSPVEPVGKQYHRYIMMNSYKWTTCHKYLNPNLGETLLQR